MAEEDKILSREAFSKLVSELEEFVKEKVMDADQKANDHSAPELYRSDMQGYARGCSHVGQEIIRRLKELF